MCVCWGRPRIGSSPLSSELVLDRNDAEWADALERPYYMYPVHVSMCFLFMPTLSTVIYLLLLRFLHRDYDIVFRLADSIATDTAYTAEEGQVFRMLQLCNTDRSGPQPRSPTSDGTPSEKKKMGSGVVVGW